MNDSRTIQGFWYLPDQTDKMIAGVLSYSRQQGCHLELVGHDDHSLLSVSNIDIILGMTEDGTSITLLSCSRISGKSNIKGVRLAKLTIQFALLGNHYSSNEEIVFHKLHASISHLGIWLGKYGCEKLEVGRNKFTIDLQYQVPDEMAFAINATTTVGFYFDVSYTPDNERMDIEIHQKTFVCISSTEPVPMRQLLNHYFTIFKFFSLAYNEAPPLLKINLRHDELRHEWDKNFPQNVELLFHDNFFNSRYKEDRLPIHFLFTFKEISDLFPVMIRNWFERFDKLAPSVNLLNELLIQRGLTVEVQFLSAIQAVETFHRNIYGGVSMPEDEHQKRMEDIVNGSPEDHKKWLQEKLAHSNEPNLRQRINNLYDRLPPDLAKRIVVKKGRFVNDVVETRNYYTHYSSSLKEGNKVMGFEKMFKSVLKLKIILIASILQELGFNHEQLKSAIKLHILFPYYE